MPYQLTAKDYEYFIPNANQIQQDDILQLTYHVLPGAKGSGFQVNYINPHTELTLYLDERENDEHLFIGGILLKSSDSIQIKKSLDLYKNKFRPELLADSWFLKGSGAWLNSDGSQVESSYEALTRWMLWAKHLKTIDTYYQFHSCSLNKSRFVGSEKSRQKQNIERYQTVYKTLFKTLEQLRFCNITIITDNVEGAQYIGLKNAISEANGNLVTNLNLVPPIRKEDFSSADSACLQFVDMQIYAMSRFIFPSGNNVLMEFEKFAYEHANGTIQKTLENLSEQERYFMIAKYYVLKDIFQHLRHKIVKRLLSPNYDEPVSSMSIISDNEYLNFGSDVDYAIHRFCNIPNSSITFDFTAS